MKIEVTMLVHHVSVYLKGGEVTLHMPEERTDPGPAGRKCGVNANPAIEPITVRGLKSYQVEQFKPGQIVRVTIEVDG